MADEDIGRKLDELVAGISKLSDRIGDSKASDGGREQAADQGRLDLAMKASAAEAERTDREQSRSLKADRAEMLEIATEAMKAVLKDTRSPSLAAAVGSGKASPGQSRLIQDSMLPASPALKAAFRDYKSGELFSAMGDFNAAKAFFDMDLANDAKARLEDLGTWHSQAPDVPGGYHVSYESRGDADKGWVKATTGATGSTGGYVLPNNLVDTLVKPATQRAVYQNLVTVRNGVNVRGVDQPFRTGAPARMTFQDWNTSKENVNETYGSYTAYLGTIARVMDITKQYARFSAGAAEADVMDELTKAAILGENYYMAVGAGTGTVGSGDPTTGVYTALSAVGQVAYKTTFSGASASTIAGSFATAMTQINSALAARSRENQAVVVDALTYWSIIGQGSNEAGFWVAPTEGPTGFTRTQSGGLAFWGTPIYYDANFNANSSTTKVALAGEWDKLKLYRGLEFRIDSSDVAGTRWDYNLIGFRGEEEIGFNALTAVAVGALQYATAVIP